MTTVKLELDLSSIDFGQLLDNIDAEMSVAMGKSIQEIADYVRDTGAPRASGALAQSTQPAGVTGKWSDGTLTGLVGVGVPYASYVELGTTGPYIIEPKREFSPRNPKRRAALRFPSRGGGYAFARRVIHPGIKGQHYLEAAAEALSEPVAKNFALAVELAVAKLEKA